MLLGVGVDAWAQHSTTLITSLVTTYMGFADNCHVSSVDGLARFSTSGTQIRAHGARTPSLCHLPQCPIFCATRSY